MRYARKYRQQKGMCFYCGIKMLPVGLADGAADPRIRTIDHKVPKFWGGKSTEENIVYACQGCNNAKGYTLLPEDRERVLKDYFSLAH